MKILPERLALFLPGLYEGGAERIILNLAKGITARGYAVDLVLARAEGPYMEQIPENVRLVNLQAPRVLGSIPALTRYLRQERPTAMVSALFSNVIALWARRLSGVPCRLIITEQNNLSSLVHNKSDARWKLYPRLAGWFYGWADTVIAVSNDVAEDLAQIAGIPLDMIQVVYNPIVTTDLQEKAEAPLSHPWFNNCETPVVVAVGRLTDQKAFDTLIRAFSLVRKKQRAHLLLIGEGENRSSLQSLIKQLELGDDVNLIGYVQNPYPFVKQASLFALPSRWEGLPTILVEALYLGTPIVATDCPGGSREILKNGLYGRLVQVDDPLGLAEAILLSLHEGRSWRPKESWEPFHLDVVLDRYVELLFGVNNA